jgi:hypothetical protein
MLPNGPWLPPYLPTTVVGSYSVPGWLERLKTEFYQRRTSARHLTDIDYFLARMPGVRRRGYRAAGVRLGRGSGRGRVGSGRRLAPRRCLFWGGVDVDDAETG